MTRKAWAVAALAMIVVTGAGCGGTDSRGGTGDNKNATAREKALKFAECMRAHGVSAFPDPDATGALTIDAVANSSLVDTSSVAFTRGLAACKDLEPSGFTGRARSPEQQKAALEFARCIRAHGVKDFPDPALDDPLVNTYRIPSSDTPEGMTVLNAAMDTCGDFAVAAGATGGR